VDCDVIVQIMVSGKNIGYKPFPFLKQSYCMWQGLMH
jgi:hypothetical protein